jgi:hypothetical protein
MPPYSAKHICFYGTEKQPEHSALQSTSRTERHNGFISRRPIAEGAPRTSRLKQSNWSPADCSASSVAARTPHAYGHRISSDSRQLHCAAAAAAVSAAYIPYHLLTLQTCVLYVFQGAPACCFATSECRDVLRWRRVHAEEWKSQADYLPGIF